MFGGEATNTNSLVFGLIRTEIEYAIYRIRGELANHYSIVVISSYRYKTDLHLVVVLEVQQTPLSNLLVSIHITTKN